MPRGPPAQSAVPAARSLDCTQSSGCGRGRLPSANRGQAGHALLSPPPGGRNSRCGVNFKLRSSLGGSVRTLTANQDRFAISGFRTPKFTISHRRDGLPDLTGNLLSHFRTYRHICGWCRSQAYTEPTDRFPISGASDSVTHRHLNGGGHCHGLPR